MLKAQQMACRAARGIAHGERTVPAATHFTSSAAGPAALQQCTPAWRGAAYKLHPAQARRPAASRRAAHVCRRAAASEASAAAASLHHHQQQEEEDVLEPFLAWLVANGVTGVGTEGIKIGIYEGEDKERGVLAMAPLAAGEVVASIPLRLAITDYQEEDAAEEGPASNADSPETQQQQQQEQQPWSARLAAQLLEMQAQGAGCPWRPYLRTLPRAVPSPLTAFSWEDIQAVQYQPMLRQLDHSSWLASAAGQQLGAASHDGAGREQVDWALSVVHSRSFGAPGKQGTVAIRMLVPLVDMLNHAGDVRLSAPGVSAQPVIQPFDNVRWDLHPPEPGQADGDWSMVVRTTRAVAEGEELLLSYGERSNDDFFLHYGFVPARNPHDTVILFTDIESAIEHWLEEYLPKGVLSPQQLQAAITSAYTAAYEQDAAAAAAEATLAAMPKAEAEVARNEMATIKLSAGGCVDGRLIAAFRSLQASCAASVEQLQCDWQEHMRAAVGQRARQILAGMPTSLLDDLQQLAAWEHATGNVQHGFTEALQHYAPLLEQQAAAAAAEAGSGASSSDRGGEPAVDAKRSSSGSQGGNTLPVVYRAYKKMILWDAVLC